MELFTRNKSNKKPIIKQIIELIPGSMLQISIAKHESDKFCSKYKTSDHLISQMLGQLNKFQTLSHISTAIAVNTTFIGDLGLKQNPARSTMSDGNLKRDWKVFETMYYKLLLHYRMNLATIAKRQFFPAIAYKNISMV